MDAQSEEKMIQLLERLDFRDFWLAFAYLKDKVRITELQAFSICIKRFSLQGAFDSNVYSAVHYSCIVDRASQPLFDPVYPYWMADSGQRPTHMSIIFQKKEDIPEHLHALHKIMLTDKDLASQVYRLCTRQKQELALEISDTLIIELLRRMGDNQAMRGVFPLQPLQSFN